MIAALAKDDRGTGEGQSQVRWEEGQGGLGRNGRLRCRLCGDVIGVYEPLVMLLGGHPLRTSLAAEPSLAGAVGDAYHGGCYDAGNAEPG
ncbi:MAG: hypothetical protein ACHQE6_04040 [Solirubrobacterales bacterium]